MTTRPNVLVSSAGRRVSLVEFFREAAAPAGGEVLATDMSPWSSAFHRADRRALVPRCTTDEFVPRTLELCAEHDIGLVVPTIDTELPALAAARDRFADAGVVVAVAPPEIIDVCADKRLTHRWLVDHDLPTVRQASVAEVLADPDAWSGPLIAKPARGSASIGVRAIDDLDELAGAADDVVVQTRASGHEYTVDVYRDADGAVRVTVPRRRIEVRSGEVSKGVTERHAGAMAVAADVAETLDGLHGCMNVQMFCDGDDIDVIEINPRFGGGYPLAHHAGATMTHWLYGEAVLGRAVETGDWESGLAMLRYDDEVLVREADLA